MWLEKKVKVPSVIDGSPLSMPAIESDDGTALIVTGFSRNLQKLFVYRDKDVQLDLQGIHYKMSEHQIGRFEVWFSSGLRSPRLKEEFVRILDSQKQREIKDKLSEAIPLWTGFLTQDEAPITSISFS